MLGSRHGRGAPLGQGLEVDRERFLFWVGRTSVLFLGDEIAQQQPKGHQQDAQHIGQNPLSCELGIGWHDAEEELLCDSKEAASDGHNQQS